MQLSPLENRIIVKQLDADDKSKGGIIIPEAVKEKPRIGVVVEVGPGKLLDNGERAKMSVKPDDRIVYAKYSGNEIEVDGETYLIFREDDVFAKFVK